ncbi:hypothetical protein DFH06DRAFT_1488478 [Mycena polygramma]|nr:hypothetical protein DFH06DRAFT_1488478 [Mycena polygramma]
MSATPLSQLRISTTSPVTTARFTTTANFDVFYDRIEYGMGFNRGALEEFVESKGNTLQVAADVLEALEDGDWVLIPEEEHLGYIIGLWYNNAQCKELEERQKYSASQESPEVDGVIHYTYHLWHIPSLNMVGPDEQHLESGMSRVSSSIPPYLWAVYASIFAMDHSKDLPDMLFLSFTLLHSLFPSMASATPLSQLRISPTSPATTARFTTTANFEAFYDPIECGMGFNRGELDEFVESKGNTLEVAEDVLDALENGDWVLIPEEEHVRAIIRLWSNNAKCKTLEERERYSPSQDNFEVDGVIHYTYRLWHVPSLCMVGPNQQGLESGTARVSSSIPPYFWAVYASLFALDHSKDLPAKLFLSFTRLLTLVDDSSVLRAFLAVEPRHARPKCLCTEEEEEKQAARNQRYWARVWARLTPGKNGELTDGQKRFHNFQQQLIQHYMECD